MSSSYVPFEKIVESQMDPLIQEDSDYAYFATPLKSPDILKQEHINQLKEFLKFTELQVQLDKAARLVMDLLPDPKIKAEFDHSSDHFLAFINQAIDEQEEKQLLLQDVFGFSDETFIKIYTLVTELIKAGNYTDAYTLLVFLTTLAPHVPSYWISEGICLQELSRHEEALAIFNGAKVLDPGNPAFMAYSIESYLALKDKEEAKQQLMNFKEIMSTYKGEDKKQWEARMSYYGGM